MKEWKPDLHERLNRYMNLTAQLTQYPGNQTIFSLDQGVIALIAPSQVHSCLYENIKGQGVVRLRRSWFWPTAY